MQFNNEQLAKELFKLAEQEPKIFEILNLVSERLMGDTTNNEEKVVDLVLNLSDEVQNEFLKYVKILVEIPIKEFADVFDYFKVMN
jgi:hypothetical protein